MDRAAVEVVTRDGAERLERSAEMPLRTGNWTIVRMGHTIPFRRADDDTLLEPGEQCDLVIYPSRPAASRSRSNGPCRPGITLVMVLG